MSDTRYYRVAPKIWRHAAANQWPHEVSLLALYLLTSPHRNIAGLYYLPLPYIMADLGFDRETLASAMGTLIAEDFARYDETAQVVLIVNALSYDAPENTNQRKGAIKALHEVPETPLWCDLYALAQPHNEGFANDIAELLAKRFPKLLRQPLPKPDSELNANTVTVSVTVTDQTNNDDNAHEREDGEAAPEPEVLRLEFTPKQVALLTKAWESKMGGTAPSLFIDRMKTFREANGRPLDIEVFEWAIDQCVKYEKRTLAYLEKVLTNCQARGHTSLVQVLAYERQRDADKPKGAAKHGQHATRVNAGRHDDLDSLDDLVQGG